MKKLLLSLASVALVAGFGAANAGEPKALDTASMDNITAGWAQKSEQENRNSRGNENRQYSSSFFSPQVNANVSPNVAVLTYNSSQQTNTSQASFQGNINH
jgi:hypothetical protein